MTIRKTLRSVALVTVLGVAVSCSPVMRNHGYIPLEEDLAQITVGVDTRETVAARVGPPSSGGVLQDTGFYYVASKFRHFGPLAPQEVSREIVAISFDAAGVVTNIERFGLDDGKVIALSRRVTDSPVQNSTFLRQLLGNIGQFDAASTFGDS